MNTQQFTQKSIEAIQTAQSMAQENKNPSIMPEHLMYALVDQDGGLIPSLFSKMGADNNAILSELDTVISGLPTVDGTSDIYISKETERALNEATKQAKSMGDEYISVEHLMLGIFAGATSEIKKIFSNHGITKSAFLKELSKVFSQFCS